MPACSVDLGLDPALDAEVREHWQTLADAGLPSLADHPDDANAPHVTLAQRRTLPDPDDVLGLASALPVPLTLTGLLVLPTRRGHVLARAVTPSASLLALHAAVAAVLGPTPSPPAAHTAPGHWTPQSPSQPASTTIRSPERSANCRWARWRAPVSSCGTGCPAPGP